jgi:TolA-binding protein
MPSRKFAYPSLELRSVIILALIAQAAMAAPPSTCVLEGDYAQALCAYQRRHFAVAEAGFRMIVDRDAKEPETLRATYFLARTLMKTGKFDEAAALFIRIYSADKAFYDTWNCDFLLGECRKAQGK